MAPFYGWGSTAWRLQSHYKETVYLLPLSPPESCSTDLIDLEGWKAELILDSASGFECWTPGLGIRHENNKEKSFCLGKVLFNHYASETWKKPILHFCWCKLQFCWDKLRKAYVASVCSCWGNKNPELQG